MGNSRKMYNKNCDKAYTDLKLSYKRRNPLESTPCFPVSAMSARVTFFLTSSHLGSVLPYLCYLRIPSSFWFSVLSLLQFYLLHLTISSRMPWPICTAYSNRYYYIISLTEDCSWYLYCPEYQIISTTVHYTSPGVAFPALTTVVNTDIYTFNVTYITFSHKYHSVISDLELKTDATCPTVIAWTPSQDRIMTACLADIEVRKKPIFYIYIDIDRELG
jgi:hypothetical protein